MQFHSYVHGANIGLSKNDRLAIRKLSDSTFCDAICFSSKPISFNKPFELKINSSARKWRGNLSIGLTTKDPISFLDNNNLFSQSSLKTTSNYLPQFASLIGLASHENECSSFIWLRELPNEWSNANLTLILTPNLNHAELMIVFNNEHQITFLHYLPVDSSFWLIVDLFGQTNSLEIVEPNLDLNNLNEEKSQFYDRIPCSVLLNGPNLIEQYKRSCALGSVRYNSGRIFLIGPSCSGKSLLKRVLLGMNTEQGDESRYNSLDTSLKCYSNGKGSWSNENPKLSGEVDVLSKEEQYANFAYNYAKMILIQQKIKQTQGETINELDVEKGKLFNDTMHNMSSIFKNALKFSIKNNKTMNDQHFDNIRQNESETEADEIMFPEKIKEQLNSMLNRKEEIMKEEFNNSNQSHLIDSYVYRMFDFSGNFVYFLLNQVILSSQAIYLLVIDISNDLETPLNQLRSSSIQVETKKCDVNTINVINFWLSVIYSHVGNPSVSFFKEKDTNATNVEEETTNVSGRNCESPQAPNNFLTTNAKITTPKVIIVATHRNSVHSEPITRNQLIEETFEKIRKNLQTKPYGRLVHSEYFAVDCKQMSFDELRILDKLRLLIDNEFINQNLVNNCVPFAWLEFEQLIDKLTKRGINFIDSLQLGELIKNQIEDDSYFTSSNFNSNLQMLINFYHLQGKLFSFNTAYQGYSNETLIVLDPIWFMNCFYKICDFVLKVNKENENLLVSGVLREELLNNVWSEQLDQKLVLVGCLEKLDMICELRPCLSIEDAADVYHHQNQIHSQLQNQTKSYIFPWITQILPEAINQTGLLYDVSSSNSLKLHVMFNVYLPIGLFSRLIIRLVRWSWGQGFGRKKKPEICHSETRIAVDFDHDLVLKIHLKKHRIDLSIIKLYESIHNDFRDTSITSNNLLPSPNVCVKVRHLVESEMEYIQSVYYRRISWILKVICPCELKCSEHDTLNCREEDCIHFLPLDECLNKKFVECDYRLIRTTFVSQYFPAANLFNNIQYSNNDSIVLFNNQNDNTANGYTNLERLNQGNANSLLTNKDPNRILLGNILSNLNSNQSNIVSNVNSGSNNFYELINGWDSISIFQMEPTFIRDAAKQLQKRNESGHDWIALSKRLGYLARDIKRLRSEEEQTPALALLRDWFESNGRTRYCIDILISCLHIIERDDVKEIIESEVKPEISSPPIFLSYQWHSQDQVLELRRKLELSGFPCWMDMTSIHGGDQLYGKIYEGISNCKVVICCLTPKYSASRSCRREVTLADVLHKPLLPIMLEPTPWPPPGPMALIMSSLVYIDLCGIGSHGGIGKKGDNESRFKEILDRITRYIAGYVDLPLFNRNYLPDLFQTQQSQDNDAILIMANNQYINNTNGLSVLQEIDRDGVELRLVNKNTNTTVETRSDQSIGVDRNDSIDDAYLVNLNAESPQQQSPNSVEHTGQLLSTNELENLISSPTIEADVRRSSNGRVGNGHQQTVFDNSIDNQSNNHETATRVEIYSLNEFDRRSMRALSSTNSANNQTSSNQVSNCSICNII